MDLQGPLYGFESNLTLNFNFNGANGGRNGFGLVLVPFDLAFYGGRNITYTGQDDLSGNAEYGSWVIHIDDVMLFWTRTLIGPSFSFLDYYRVNLLSGVGYKYTYDYQNDETRWFRENHLLYVPLVLQFQYSRDDFSVLAHAEYDFLIRGWQFTSNYMDLRRLGYNETAKSSLEKPMEQKKGYGLRTYAEFDFSGFTVTPFF